MSGPRKSVKGAGKLGRKPRYASPPPAGPSSAPAQAAEHGDDDDDAGYDDDDAGYGDIGDVSMLDDDTVLPSVERGDHDSEDASDSDPFASDKDDAADSDEDLPGLALLSLGAAAIDDEDRTVREMLGGAREAAVHGETIHDEIVVSTDFNDLGVDDDAVPFGPENLPIELRPKEKADPTDISELVVHRYNPQLDLSLFEEGLALWADLSGISRDEWKSLREILGLLKFDGKPHRDVENLPKQLDTLKKRIRTRLPLINMRKASIPVKVEKLPTERESKKRDRKGKAKTKTSEADKVETEIHFFDPESLFRKILSSDLADDMHHGPATFVDEPVELYQSQAWAASIRASAGQYPHLKFDNPDGGPMINGAAIFPSDFIHYRCTDENCGCQKLGEDSPEDAWHLGRVVGFGHDHRSSPCATGDVLVLQIQEAFYHDDTRVPDRISEQLPMRARDEVLLTQEVIYIPETHAWSHAKVFVDRASGEDFKNPTPSHTFVRNVQKATTDAGEAQKKIDEAARQGKRTRVKVPKIPVDYPKYDDAANLLPERTDEELVVRFMFHGSQLIPMCHTHAIRAELEIREFGRPLFEQHWDTAQEGVTPTITMPLLTFIDGFGVYRNSYRTLTGFYCTPAGLSENDRSREANVFPVALSPHGSDFGDMVKALKSMRYLDEGIAAHIKGKDVRICVYSMCYTGDMPQQAENTGFKGPRAHKFCRFCFAGAKGDLTTGQPASSAIDFDIVTHGRYHIQAEQMQHNLGILPSKEARADYGTQWGINQPSPPLASISPALDIIMTRPPDAAHSEYAGITNMMHFFLRDIVLSVSARDEYAIMLRNWPFPPGAPRLMSPTHHLNSYDLSSHARWSIVVPTLLREWLEESHIQTSLVAQLSKFGNPVDVVVGAYAALAKSNSVLMGRKISSADRQNMEEIIRSSREKFRQLHMCASQAATMGSRAGSVAAQSRAGTAAPGEPPAGELPAPTAVTAISKKAAQFIGDTLRPNVHIGIHYPQFTQEYGIPKNVNTLEGENYHRYLKNRAGELNHTNIEKIFFEKINTAKTLRLDLRNASSDDVKLTEDLRTLYTVCPSLFKRVLSETDRFRLGLEDQLDIELNLDDDDPDADRANESHLQASIINAIPTAEVMAGGGRPMRASQVDDDFVDQLRLAYELDYGFEPGRPVNFGKLPIQWARKFSFLDGTSKHEDKFVFSVGNYVKFRENRFGRVDGIMLFDVMGIHRHIFITLTELKSVGHKDPVLGLDVMEEKQHGIIVGIKAILPEKLYMVPVNNVGIVLVDWDVYYM